MTTNEIYKYKCIKKMMNKIYLILFLGIILMNSVNAEVESMGYVEMGKCIQLLQSAVNSTYSNITTISFPNKTEILSLNKAMTKNGIVYNYSFCSTSSIGQYIVNGITDIDGVPTNWAYDFEVSSMGIKNSTTFYIICILIIVLLLGLGFYIEDAWLIIFGGMGLMVLGIYSYNYGIADIKDRVVSYSISLFVIFTGAYLSLRSGFTLVED